VSAPAARSTRRPPLRATSRLSVDGARPSSRLIARSDWPHARRREISSRSAGVRANRDRRRGRGVMPPSAATRVWITLDARRSPCAICLTDSPRCHRAHSSFRSLHDILDPTHTHTASDRLWCCVDGLCSPHPCVRNTVLPISKEGHPKTLAFSIGHDWRRSVMIGRVRGEKVTLN
jgi:hypothetical protein